MDEVFFARKENINLRKIRGNFSHWEIRDCHLVQITNKQQNVFQALIQLIEDPRDKKSVPVIDMCDDKFGKGDVPSFQLLQKPKVAIENANNFLLWCTQVDAEGYVFVNKVYSNYYNRLNECSNESDKILCLTEKSLVSLNTLQIEYAFMSNKTQSLNTCSENLIKDQRLVNNINKEINRRIYYFVQAEHLMKRLQSPTLSVSSDSFRECLDKIDESLNYLQSNAMLKEASIYINRYNEAVTKSAALMRSYVMTTIKTSTDQVLLSKQGNTIGNDDAVFALYYGKFQTSAAKVKRISSIIEERSVHSTEYEQLLGELQDFYLSERANIMCPAVNKSVHDLKLNYKGDYCVLLRSSCVFIVHICQDEYRLFSQFYSVPNTRVNTYLEGLCTILYDALRPCIIQINYLETLAEICGILKVEMLEEYVEQNCEALNSFGKTVSQLLQDVQERLVFRAHLYLQSDILHYKPSPGDLAYPEKLEMMQDIALSLQGVQRCESRSSIVSANSNIREQTDNLTDIQSYPRISNSPADLHGMWYPTVRRTLVCLSRIYRCVDRSVFQGLSQEAIKCCIKSITMAALQIARNKGIIDGELFEIKHLLILREQIAPFRVDFTVKETSLDFSKVKTAAFELLQKRKQFFSLSTNNALLEFLLDGTPQVKEHFLDSRKEIDIYLKAVCEKFIRDSVNFFVGSIIDFLARAQSLLYSQHEDGINVNSTLRQSPWASCQQISKLIQESQRIIKNDLTGFQRSMQLYLSSKDTEFIIFRPIRNNIIGTFIKLEQLLSTNGYDSCDMTIINSPSAEQISLLISSASILASSVGTARKTSNLSIDESGTSYKTSEVKS